MEIKKATTKDLPEILKILNFEIQNSTSVYDENPKTIETMEQWFADKSLQNFPVFVALENKLVVAYGTLGRFRPHDGYRFTVEHSIYVSENNRGQGIGRALLNQLILSSRELGFHSMIAGIDAKNVKSRFFHQDFGFVEIGQMKEVGYKFNTWLDLVFLQKML